MSSHIINSLLGRDVARATRLREFSHLRAKMPANPTLRAASASARTVIVVRETRVGTRNCPHLSASFLASSRKKKGLHFSVNARMRATLLPGGSKCTPGRMGVPKTHHILAFFSSLNAHKCQHSKYAHYTLVINYLLVRNVIYTLGGNCP